MIIDSSQKKSQPSHDSILKKLGIIFIILLVLVLGLIAGGYIGFYGMLYISQVYDYYNPPTSPGGGLGAVGWIFTFITIPLGAMIGGILSLLIYVKISKPKK
jgi:hypothetical protein